MSSSSATDSADEPCASSTDIPLEDSYKIAKLVSDLTALIDSIEDEYTRLTLRIQLEELKFERIQLLSKLVENRGSQNWLSVKSRVVIASKELVLHLTELLVRAKTYQTAERKISLQNPKCKETRKRLWDSFQEDCKNSGEFAKRAKLCVEEQASSSSTDGCRSHLKRRCRLAEDRLCTVTSDEPRSKDNTSSEKKKSANSSISCSKDKKPASKRKQEIAEARNTSKRIPIVQITPLKVNKDAKLKEKKQKENCLGPFSFFSDTEEPCSSLKTVKPTGNIKDLCANRKKSKKVIVKDKKVGKSKANVDNAVKGKTEANNADKNVARNENIIVIPTESINAIPIVENDILASLDDTKLLEVEHIEIMDSEADHSKSTVPIQLCSNVNPVSSSDARQSHKKEVTDIKETAVKQVKSADPIYQPSNATPKCLNSNNDAKNKNTVTLDKAEKNYRSLHKPNSVFPADTKNNADKPCKKSLQNSTDDKGGVLDNDLAEQSRSTKVDNLDSNKDSFINITNKTLPTKEIILAGNSYNECKKEGSDKCDKIKNPSNQITDKLTRAEKTVSSPIVQKIIATKKRNSQEKHFETPYIGVKNRIIIEPEMLEDPQNNLKECDNKKKREVDCQVGEHDTESKAEAQERTGNLTKQIKEECESNECLPTNSTQSDTNARSWDSTDKTSEDNGKCNESSNFLKPASKSEESVRLYYPEDDANKKVKKSQVVDHVDLPEVILGTQEVQNKRRIVLKPQVDKTDTNKKKDTDASVPEKKIEETEQALTLTIQKSVEKDKDLLKDYFSSNIRSTVSKTIECTSPLVTVKHPIETHSKQYRAPKKNIKKTDINENQKTRNFNNYGWCGGFTDYCDDYDYYRRCNWGTEKKKGHPRRGHQHFNNLNRPHADFRQRTLDMRRNDIYVSSKEKEESINQVFRHVMNEKNARREFDNHSLSSAVTVRLNDFDNK